MHSSNQSENGGLVSNAIKSVEMPDLNYTATRSGHDAAKQDGPQHDKTNNSGHNMTNSKKTIPGKLLKILKENALLFFTFCGVLIGFGLGFVVRGHDLSDSGLMWLGKTDRLDMPRFVFTVYYNFYAFFYFSTSLIMVVRIIQKCHWFQKVKFGINRTKPFAMNYFRFKEERIALFQFEGKRTEFR